MADSISPPLHLAELLTDEPAGQKLLWSYDLGDNWFHIIEVEAVRSAEESTGRVEVLAGEVREGSGREGSGPQVDR